MINKIISLTIKVILFVALFVLNINFSKASDINSITIDIKSSERKIIKPAIQKSLIKALNFYKEEYGLNLTRPLKLIASQDSNYISEQWHESFQGEYSLQLLKKLQKNDCKRTKRISGNTDLYTLRICFNSPIQITPLWLEFNQNQLDILIAHELMHVFQRQLSDSYDIEVHKRAKQGPKWMLEGHAVYLHKQFETNNRWDMEQFPFITSKAIQSKNSLNDIFLSRSRLSSDDYNLAHFAVFLLVKRYGKGSVMGYWRNLKAGNSWEITFKQTFGLDMNQFMEDVERLKLDESAALAWIERS